MTHLGVSLKFGDLVNPGRIGYTTYVSPIQAEICTNGNRSGPGTSPTFEVFESYFSYFTADTAEASTAMASTDANMQFASV